MRLILSLIQLLLVAIDILLFFILVKILCYRLNLALLTALDSIGTPLVDWFIEYIRKALGHISQKYFSRRALLVTGMLALMFLRLLLGALFSK